MHLGRDRVICAYEVNGLIIDPGPGSCVETLLDQLGPTKPRALLLTHIHLDHAGASGILCRRFPELQVYVHEVGAPHLIDPSKLLESAGRLYGDDMWELWGEVAPVPEDRVHALSGGETVDGFRVAYTPGHASHHVCFLHEATGWAFVGDMAGVRIPPSGLTLAPTPPPDIDVEAWEHSLSVIAAWEPAGLALTHFGTADDPSGQLTAVKESLRWQADLAAQTDQEGFMAALHERIVENEPEKEVAAVEQAAPLDHLFLGLDRWHRKRG